MQVTTPAWGQGMTEWPAFETNPAVSDWSPYDRLVVDITNPNEERYKFAIRISDSKVPFLKGFCYRFALPSRGFRRFEIPLSAFPETIDRSDIAIVHFFATRPHSDLVLALSNMVLLRPGESLPDPDSKVMKQFVSLSLDSVLAVEQTVAKGRLESLAIDGNAQVRECAQSLFAQFDTRLTGLRAKLVASDLTTARLDAINEELAVLPSEIDRAVSVLRFRKAYGDTGLPSSDMFVGVATSMEKIPPRGMPFNLPAARDVELSLAKNEKESLQIAVLPAVGSLRNVTVRVGDLTTADGVVFHHENIDCDVVGYVQTKQRPPYDVAYVGYWADPILSGIEPVDIAAGDLQTFWIRVRAPKGQAAGLYRGTLQVSAEGIVPVTLGFSVRVRGFAVPDRSPLPLAITFEPHDSVMTETKEEQAECCKSKDYPVNAWQEHKLQWADFLADYYISYDSLYHQGMPDFDVLTHLHQQNRLGLFNLGYYGHAPTHPGSLEKWKVANLPRFRQAYVDAKKLGILDHAYIYGCDEATQELFPLVEQAAATLKAEFPDVPIMTTSYDQSYGMQSPIKSVDAFCPLTSSFDPANAAKARTAGKHVWWYIGCVPVHPYANMFVEYSAMEGRLLMGAMTAKQRPDGFLYYQISIWNSRKPITTGPFTDWDPRSWTTFHGDGSWTCVGPGGTPLPTVRLENFRDGLEDFVYVVLLEELVRRRQAEGDAMSSEEKQWLAEAKEAVAVPDALVKTMTEYSCDPTTLYAWRNRIADLIDRSGIVDVFP